MDQMSISTTPPYALEVSPESILTFTLNRNDEVPKCVMTLRHPGGNDAIAFKVKTTQPRRYLVRPNQGLVLPGQLSTVSILLVEKDKQALLQSYDRLGPSALEHSKDKFLVQSCVVSPDFARKEGKILTESLTGMWNQVGSKGDMVYNKKLHVRHMVSPQGMGKGSGSVPAASASAAADPKLENMTPEQIYDEISNLRRKYDELVAFSVNLTAERDILNNTLEQTKRDLNREMQSKGVTDTGANSKSSGRGGSLILTILQILIVGISCFIMGGLYGEEDVKAFIENLPVLGDYLMKLNGIENN